MDEEDGYYMTQASSSPGKGMGNEGLMDYDEIDDWSNDAGGLTGCAAG